MIELNGIKCFSLNELFKIKTEEEILKHTEGFVCTKNAEVERFLKHNAIEFNRKHQAMTYLLFDDNKELLGYFSLSVKPISIHSDILSNNEFKKILRITEVDPEDMSLNPAAYLVAQLAKKDESEIDIDVIFKFINYYINEVQEICGGVIEFLESENKEKLINLYRNIGFKIFNIRKSKSGEDRKLIQMYRLI